MEPGTIIFDREINYKKKTSQLHNGGHESNLFSYYTFNNPTLNEILNKRHIPSVHTRVPSKDVAITQF